MTSPPLDREGVRIAVFSDVHGNVVALDAVLADAGDATSYWFLGDLVAHGPRPAECVRRLRDLPVWSRSAATPTATRSPSRSGRVVLADLAAGDHPSADWLIEKLTTPWG